MQSGVESESDEVEDEDARRLQAAIEAVLPLLKPSSRVLVSMSVPAQWYGATVFADLGDASSRIFGFDDGDIRTYPIADLAMMHERQGLKQAAPDSKGVVANKSGHLMADKLTYHKPGGTAVKKVVGVLIGREEAKLGDVDIHAGHTMLEQAFAKPAGAPTSSDSAKRSSRSKSAAAKSNEEPPIKKRDGWYTFNRGDYVEYTYIPPNPLHADKGLLPGESCEAAIFGVAYHDEEGMEGKTRQARKYLIIYHEESSTFFPSFWTRWRRIPKLGVPDEFDVDDCRKVFAFLNPCPLVP